jgi:CheY-like chemotaxis protein
MGSVLAIEGDPHRRRLLTTLVREHVNADLTVVESVKAAFAIMAMQTPDLILAPTLLSPQDEAELITRVRQLSDAPYVQMITLPALDMLVEPPREKRRALDIFTRRPVSVGLQYDPRMVVAQIVDGLDRARALRVEHEVSLAHAEWRAAAIESSTETAMTVFHKC